MRCTLGVTSIEINTALVTVSEAVPTLPPNVAVIVLFPGISEVANPASLLIDTTPGEEEFQATSLVMSCLVLSSYMPIAVN